MPKLPVPFFAKKVGSSIDRATLLTPVTSQVSLIGVPGELNGAADVPTTGQLGCCETPKLAIRGPLAPAAPAVAAIEDDAALTGGCDGSSDGGASAEAVSVGVEVEELEVPGEVADDAADPVWLPDEQDASAAIAPAATMIPSSRVGRRRIVEE